MKSLASTFAFIDLLFNLLLGITMMFIVSYLMINPPEDNGQITPPVLLMVTMEWEPDSSVDMDLWTRGPTNDWVGFRNRENGYMALERDDMGAINDTFVVNGETVTVKRNYEVINFTALPEGEYFVNSHYWSLNKTEATTVHIEIIALNPFRHIFDGEITLTTDEENTIISFVVDDQEQIVDMRNDIQLLFMSRESRTGGGN